MRAVVFLVAACAGASALFAAPPDGYLSEAACGLAEPVGAGLSLPLPSERRVTQVPADLKVEEVEQRIGAWLDRKLHYPEHVRVHCSRGPGLADGHFDEIRIEIKGGQLDFVPLASGVLRLAPVDIDIPRLWRDSQVDIRGTSFAEAHLEVSEQGLNDVMLKKAEDLKVERPHIALGDGTVRFSARMRTLVIKNDVMTAGRFELTDGHLNFHPTALKVGFIPLPGAALSALARRFNPILEVKDIHPIKGIAFQLERVVVLPGKLILETSRGDQIATR